MNFDQIADVILLTVIWFIVYWILAGIVFAVIGLIRFRRVNTLRFSCSFTFLSLATAFGAVITGYVTTTRTSPECLENVHIAYKTVGSLLKCAAIINIPNSVLWFVVLLAAGLGMLFISTLPKRR